MLLQTIPLSAPLWAVLADEDGKPVYERAVSLAAFDVNPQTGHRVICAMTVAQNGHIEPPDSKEGFIGYTFDDPESPTFNAPDWEKRAAETRAAITKKKAETKLYTPPRKQIAEHVH